MRPEVLVYEALSLGDLSALPSLRGSRQTFFEGVCEERMCGEVVAARDYGTSRRLLLQLLRSAIQLHK